MVAFQRSLLAIAASLIATAGASVALPSAATAQAATNAGYDMQADFAAAPLFTTQDLAVSGQDGFTCYRIPALTSTPDGSVLAAYDGRPGSCADAPNPNSIVLRKSTDNGETFGEPQIISAGQGGSTKYGYSDPSFIVDWETGTIFNMHVYSLDRSFQSANNSTDLHNRQSIHVSYTTSVDNGDTWSPDVVITPQLFTNNGPFYGKFATSGNGIQLRYGAHKGRLVQPAVVRTASGSYQAMMWMSDDHGATWFAGQPVGTNMDENKVVELSDGTLMMNSRPKSTTERRIAFSHDGGMTWSEDVPEPNLPDPRNNASIIRAFPNAPEGSAAAKVLLFSNTASTSGRKNPTVRMSCDDGKTWPVAKAFTPYNTSYTHLATLPDGDVGILYEDTTGGMKMKFSKFNAAWLGSGCLNLTSSQPLELAPGASLTADVIITNVLGNEIIDRDISFSAPAGITVTAPPLTLAPGEQTTLPITFTASATADLGKQNVTATIANDEEELTGQIPVVIAGTTAPTLEQIRITGQVRNPQATYEAGDVVALDFIVKNPTAQAIGIYPQPGSGLAKFDPQSTPNCRWTTFAAHTTATCGSATYTVTADDVARGEINVDTQWLIGNPGARVITPNPVLRTIPVTVAADFGMQTAVPVRQATLALSALGNVVSPQTDQTVVPVKATITTIDTDDLPAGTKVAFYLDGSKQGEAEVVKNQVEFNLSVASVPLGSTEQSHRLLARLVSPLGVTPAVVAKDTALTFTVLPQEKQSSALSLHLAPVASFTSDGNNRTIAGEALVQAGTEPLSGQTVTFTLNGKQIGTAISNAEGRAVVAVSLPPVPSDAEPATYELAATVAGYESTTTTFAGDQAAVEFTVAPQPAPVVPEPPAPSVNPAAFRLQLHQGGWYVARYEISWNETAADGTVTRKYWQGNNQDRTLGRRDEVVLPSNASAIHVVVKRYTGWIWAPWKVSYDNWHDGVTLREINIYGTTFNGWGENKVIQL